jgi:hypothetical protein
VKVDFEATWQEPLDDVNDPNGPKTLNGGAHVYEGKMGVQDTEIEIKTSVTTVQGSSPEATPPASPAPASGVARQGVVATPLAPQKVVASEVKTVTAATNTQAVAVKPGTLIPADVRGAPPSIPLHLRPAPPRRGEAPSGITENHREDPKSVVRDRRNTHQTESVPTDDYRSMGSGTV